MSELTMSVDELRTLPVSVDLVTAGRAFGLGRTKAFELVRSGTFPCRVIPVGNRYRVPRSAILEALGIDDSSIVLGADPAVARPSGSRPAA